MVLRGTTTITSTTFLHKKILTFTAIVTRYLSSFAEVTEQNVQEGEAVSDMSTIDAAVESYGRIVAISVLNSEAFAIIKAVMRTGVASYTAVGTVCVTRSSRDLFKETPQATTIGCRVVAQNGREVVVDSEPVRKIAGASPYLTIAMDATLTGIGTNELVTVLAVDMVMVAGMVDTTYGKNTAVTRIGIIVAHKEADEENENVQTKVVVQGGMAQHLLVLIHSANYEHADITCYASSVVPMEETCTPNVVKAVAVVVVNETTKTTNQEDTVLAHIAKNSTTDGIRIKESKEFKQYLEWLVNQKTKIVDWRFEKLKCSLKRGF